MRGLAIERWSCLETSGLSTNLMHGISEERLQGAAFARRVLLEPGQHAREVRILLALGQYLQAEVVVAHVFLINVEHRQEYVEQVACAERTRKFIFKCCN